MEHLEILIIAAFAMAVLIFLKLPLGFVMVVLALLAVLLAVACLVFSGAALLSLVRRTDQARASAADCARLAGAWILSIAVFSALLMVRADIRMSAKRAIDSLISQ